MNTVTDERTKQSFLVVRQQQIMFGKIWGMYTQKVLLLAAVGVIILQITMTYLCDDLVWNWNAAEFTLFVGIGMFFTMALLVFCMFLLENLGKVDGSYTNSRKEFRANKTIMKRQCRKFAMSCRLLRIHLGEQNFVEPNTCLVFEYL